MNPEFTVEGMKLSEILLDSVVVFENKQFLVAKIVANNGKLEIHV